MRILEGAFWIAILLGLVLFPLLALLAGDPPAGMGFAWDFAIALGFAGLTMMGLQFLLTARFRRATAPYGIDVIYYFHRYLAVIALLLVLGHAGLLIRENPSFLQAFDPRVAPGHLFAGAVSAAALLILVASSLWRKQIRLHYDAWRILHVILAVAAVVLALVHVDGVGYYVGSPPKRMLWVLIVSTWVAVTLHVRFFKPLRLLRRPYRVTAVREERGSAWTLAMEPVGHAGFEFEAGQFCWLTLGHSPFAMKEHPFSISSAPRADGRLEVTIKELGDFTRTVGLTEIGATAFVDGPYGAFTMDRHVAPGYVFIGGGIGMAPLMSMMRSLAEQGDRRRHTLFMANSSVERTTFLEDVRDLERRLRLTVVHVVEEAPDGWTGERGFLTAAILERGLPADRCELEYFVCGPTPMLAAVERALYDIGVPLRHSHSELFDLV
ncbi:MAG: ferric reductase-like transmembrane domain-containing protein [Candidatus Binatia bacterium]